MEALQPRVKTEKLFAHPKKEEGSGAVKKQKVDWKAINVTVWMLAYADEVGDMMPDESVEGGSTRSWTAWCADVWRTRVLAAYGGW